MQYLVSYAKLSSIKRKRDIIFKGPFVGGVVNSEKEAKELIDKIIMEQKGFAILPKVITIDKGLNDAKTAAVQEFKKMRHEIMEADQIINRK